MQELLIVLNLVLLESLLSVDNAAVLAVMVRNLPEEQQGKALKYGLLGAYVFRGLCLFFAAWLVKIVWLKIVGGAYLLYLTYSHFTAKDEDGDGFEDDKGWMTWLKTRTSPLVGTIILVEIMDLAFSIDNVFAAVAMTDNLWLIMVGVMIGILAMRFVAQKFVGLMKKYPSLDTSAFIVIALLGIKLVLGGAAEYIQSWSGLKTLLESHVTDLVFSLVMMIIFFIPILIKKPSVE